MPAAFSAGASCLFPLTRMSVFSYSGSLQEGPGLQHLVLLIILLCGLWGVAPTESSAQSSPPPASTADSVQDRRAALRAARARKQAELDAEDRAPLEQFLLWVENGRVLQQIGGLGGERKTYRVGPPGLGSGTGIGLRLTYVPSPLRRTLNMKVTVGGTTKGYWRLRGSVGYRHNSIFTTLYSQATRRAQHTHYIALENTVGPNDSRRFDVLNWTSGGLLGVRLLPGISIAASTSYHRYNSQLNPSETQPQDPTILNPATPTRYITVGAHLQLDRRNVRYSRNFGNRFLPSADHLTSRPLNPESGTLLSLNLAQFNELTDEDATFHQAEAEWQQYFSFYNGYHTFALRHRTVLTGPTDATIPFYQLPYVGGDFTVRGYRAYRFRGPPHGLLYNLEYRYKVWHYADMVLFGDAGKLFDEVQKWGFSNLRYSYGMGVRLVTRRSTFFRFGVAFNEKHVPRLILKFGNVF